MYFVKRAVISKIRILSIFGPLERLGVLPGREGLAAPRWGVPWLGIPGWNQVSWLERKPRAGMQLLLVRRQVHEAEGADVAAGLQVQQDEMVDLRRATRAVPESTAAD